MELIQRTRAARVTYAGTTTFDMSAEQELKIETDPGGEEILSADAPAGKQWLVSISVNIVETDAA